jgi:hypothetical protein
MSTRPSGTPPGRFGVPDSRYGIAFGISNCVTGSGMVDMVDRDYLPADPPEVRCSLTPGQRT